MAWSADVCLSWLLFALLKEEGKQRPARQTSMDHAIKQSKVNKIYYSYSAMEPKKSIYDIWLFFGYPNPLLNKGLRNSKRNEVEKLLLKLPSQFFQSGGRMKKYNRARVLMGKRASFSTSNMADDTKSMYF